MKYFFDEVMWAGLRRAVVDREGSVEVIGVLEKARMGSNGHQL